MNKVSLKEVQFKHRHMNEEVSMRRNFWEMGTHIDIHTFSMKALHINVRSRRNKDELELCVVA